MRNPLHLYKELLSRVKVTTISVFNRTARPLRERRIRQVVDSLAVTELRQMGGKGRVEARDGAEEELERNTCVGLWNASLARGEASSAVVCNREQVWDRGQRIQLSAREGTHTSTHAR
eukprot:4933872-Pleurochrysis_carterae.AAC.1